MSPSIKIIHQYITTDTTIEILPDTFAEQNINPTGLYLMDYALKSILTLTKFNRVFIDYNKSNIYVRQRDFPNNPDITYIIDGKTFKQDMGVTDGYGLIKKHPKANKALQKKLKTIDKDNCTIEIVRGLAAYKRFGIDKFYGVIIIKTKK
ncbi:hypothetical protein [Flavihumibacter solisilvae]|nr:hypothetical protein [Flavihumibacter solisilvae]